MSFLVGHMLDAQVFNKMEKMKWVFKKAIIITFLRSDPKYETITFCNDHKYWVALQSDPNIYELS